MSFITSKDRYENLSYIRAHYLRRARACSELSIPSLIPKEENQSNNGGQSFTTPYQSIAARGVNNLASKLMLTLLPPNEPFFRLVVDKSQLPKTGLDDGMTNTSIEEIKEEIDRGLSKIEQAVIAEIATTQDRVVLFEALKHLIVGGNALLFVDEEDNSNMRCFHLDQYVVVRDNTSKVLEIIVKETMSPVILEEELGLEAKKQILKSLDDKTDNDDVDKRIDIYTHIKRQETQWTIHQEIGGKIIEASRGSYPLDACPWIPMRLIRVDGEDYGRSYMEEYYGDVKSLEGLTQAIIEGSAAAAKVIYLRAPGAVLRERDIAGAPNLSILTGNKEDISVLQMEKFPDFRIARETMLGIEQRLSHAFILNSAIQRQAERVTAEEIRKMVEDLETALGGVYSLLSAEFQLPYVAVKLDQLQKKGKIPSLPKEVIKPAIVTGIEALGRGNDKTKLVELGSVVANIFREQGLQLVDVESFIIRLCKAIGVDHEGLLISREERENTMAQMQAQQNIQALGPEAIRTAGKYMMQQDQQMNSEEVI